MNKKWDRKLGTSKREQGIVTSKRLKPVYPGYNWAVEMMQVFLARSFQLLSPEAQERVKAARLGRAHESFLARTLNKIKGKEK